MLLTINKDVSRGDVENKCVDPAIGELRQELSLSRGSDF
jgi:hypothetical protein